MTMTRTWATHVSIAPMPGDSGEALAEWANVQIQEPGGPLPLPSASAPRAYALSSSRGVQGLHRSPLAAAAWVALAAAQVAAPGEVPDV